MDELSVGGSQRLPVWLSQFFGRQDETAELARLIEDVRLLTLVGAPGSGKTRLSIELAGVVGPRFPGGSGSWSWRRSWTQPRSPAPWEWPRGSPNSRASRRWRR